MSLYNSAQKGLELLFQVILILDTLFFFFLTEALTQRKLNIKLAALRSLGPALNLLSRWPIRPLCTLPAPVGIQDALMHLFAHRRLVVSPHIDTAHGVQIVYDIVPF